VTERAAGSKLLLLPSRLRTSHGHGWRVKVVGRGQVADFDVNRFHVRSSDCRSR
jgi:hypothetical protein